MEAKDWIGMYEERFPEIYKVITQFKKSEKMADFVITSLKLFQYDLRPKVREGILSELTNISQGELVFWDLLYLETIYLSERPKLWKTVQGVIKGTFKAFQFDGVLKLLSSTPFMLVMLAIARERLRVHLILSLNCDASTRLLPIGENAVLILMRLLMRLSDLGDESLVESRRDVKKGNLWAQKGSGIVQKSMVFAKTSGNILIYEKMLAELDRKSRSKIRSQVNFENPPEVLLFCLDNSIADFNPIIAYLMRRLEEMNLVSSYKTEIFCTSVRTNAIDIFNLSKQFQEAKNADTAMEAVEIAIDNHWLEKETIEHYLSVCGNVQCLESVKTLVSDVFTFRNDRDLIKVPTWAYRYLIDLPDELMILTDRELELLVIPTKIDETQLLRVSSLLETTGKELSLFAVERRLSGLVLSLLPTTSQLRSKTWSLAPSFDRNTLLRISIEK